MLKCLKFFCELHKAFEQFGLKITAELNLHVVNFLDVTFDVSTGKYKPYRKPNDDPLYIHKHSNHSPSILRQLPTSINKRISTLSSDKQTFEDAAPAYQNALGHSNFSHKLEYTQGRRNWGGRRGSCPPCLLLGGARGAKVPFKYKEYYINSFRGAFS